MKNLFLQFFIKFSGATFRYIKRNENGEKNLTKIESIRKKALVITLCLLTASLAFAAIPNFSTAAVDTQTTPSKDYSNLLQYEWPTARGSNTGSFYSAGPAPSSPGIQWKSAVPGIRGPLVAFNGLVFAAVSDGTVAINGTTGEVVWQNKVGGDLFRYGWGIGMAKIDDNYMVIYNTCVKISDGSVVWVGPRGFSVPYLIFNGAGYVPELKMFVDATSGWNLPDPSQPPTLAWSVASDVDVGSGYAVYGDGKVFIGGSDAFLRCRDAKTGALLWETPTTVNNFIYGMSYAEGRVFHGGLDGNMRAWNATNGELLWTYNPHSFYNMWASSTAYAYGIVYEHNQDAYLYAVNASTGELIWRQNGPGVGYSGILSIADGKVYCEMGSNVYRDPVTGEYGHDEFNCYDAFTGQLIWSLPMQNDDPMNYQCIAYGNLYVVPTSVPTNPTGEYTYSYDLTVGELWCISSQVNDWSMFLSDSAHSAEGAGPTDLKLNWKFEADAAIVSNPTLVNGVCYFGCFDKNIYAVDAATGSKLWAFKTNFAVKSSPAVVNGMLYTGADDGNVYCLNAATGTKIWQTGAGNITNSQLGGSDFRSSPVVVGNTVYVGALDGNLYCIDANSGVVSWKFQTGASILATPVVYNNAVYITSSTQPNGSVYCLEAATGNIIWNATMAYYTLVGPYLVASPTLAPDLNLLFVRDGYRLNYALNASTGATVWTYQALNNPSTPQQANGAAQMGSMIYKYGKVYLNDYYGVSCLNATDGTRLWYTYLNRENLAQSLTCSYGRIYTVNEARMIYVLDAQTGAKLSYYDQFGSQTHSAPTPYNGFLYIGCYDWNLYCFGDARLMTAATTESSPEPTSIPTPTETPTSTPEQVATSTPTATPTQTPAPTAKSTSAATPSPQPTETPTPEPTVSSSDTTLYVAIGIVVVIVVVAAAVLLLRKRK
jgi:outer membrane protein assembly factor BamB